MEKINAPSIQRRCVPVFASADYDESADDDAGESDADAHTDPRHWLLVQVVEAIRKTCSGSRHEATLCNKPGLIFKSKLVWVWLSLTCGESGATGKSGIMTRGGIFSYCQLHHVRKRAVAHVVGCWNFYQVNLAWTQVLQQRHGDASCGWM